MNEILLLTELKERILEDPSLNAILGRKELVRENEIRAYDTFYHGGAIDMAHLSSGGVILGTQVIPIQRNLGPHFPPRLASLYETLPFCSTIGLVNKRGLNLYTISSKRKVSLVEGIEYFTITEEELYRRFNGLEEAIRTSREEIDAFCSFIPN